MTSARRMSGALLIAGGLMLAGATAIGTYKAFKGELSDYIYPALAVYALGAVPIAVGYGIRRDIEKIY